MEPEPLYEEDLKKIEDRDAYIAAHPEESEHQTELEEPTEVTVEVPTNPSCWKKTQKKVAHFVNTSGFEALITACILFNTLAMALEHFEMDKTFSRVLEICNLVSISNIIDFFLCVGRDIYNVDTAEERLVTAAKEKQLNKPHEFATENCLSGNKEEVHQVL